MILAIDPGNQLSAYALLDEETLKPATFGKIPNEELLSMLHGFNKSSDILLAIEMVECFGMQVGVSVFETVFWIGRFWETLQNLEKTKIYRKEVKINLCHSMKAKDANIRQALIDRFGVVGTKKAPGWFYGVSKDVWSAIAIGVTYHDMYLK